MGTPWNSLAPAGNAAPAAHPPDIIPHKAPPLKQLVTTIPAVIARRRTSNRAIKPARSAPARTTARILILDNEPSQVQSLCDVLEPHDYATTCLSSAAAALAVLSEQVFDLVITELKLPEMDGLAFLRAAREIDSDLVGIVMTGQDTTNNFQALEPGAVDYIVKPFQLSAVLSVIVRALGVRQLRLQNIHLQQAVGIYELSMVIPLTLDFDAVLEKVAEAAMGHAQIAGVSMLLPFEDGKELRVAVALGINAARDEGRRIPMGKVLARWIERSMKRVSRLNERANVQTPLPLALSQFPGSTSVAMLSGGRFVGILNYTSRNPLRTATAQQIKALNILAGAAAAALEAATLLEKSRTAERRYRSLAESAADIIFRYELYPQRHVGYMNPASTLTYGYSPDEFYADPELILKIVHPDDCLLKESVLRGEFAVDRTVILRCINRNGKTVWIEQRATRVEDSNGRLIAVEGIARDITVRQTLEEQLRQSQKMEAVGLLAGGIAHDFNNVLTVIIGYSELILKDDSPSGPIAEKVDRVKRAAQHAAELTSQLLAFARRQLIQHRVLDLNTIVESNTQMLRRTIGEDIELATTLDPDLGSVKADASQVEQILMNLVVNAKHAMPLGGRITIETQNVGFDGFPAGRSPDATPGPYVMLAVSDTGCGMDSATQTRIFEPFFTTKELGKGTGLGLSIVYGIVKQNAGNIRVISEPGQGARFEILLPRSEGQLDNSERTVGCSIKETIGSETILVVEDDPVVRELVSTIINNGGYEVLLASDGNEALRIFEQSEDKIGLILCDIVMPGMSGPILIQSIKQLNPGMKFLYMSGYAGDVAASARVFDSGIDFLQKPFTAANLIRSIRRILDNDVTGSRIA